MAVSILARQDAYHDGVQPFDARRHLRAVADLVGRVFADELDARGRSAIREMQAVGKISPLVGGLMQSGLFEEMLSGYVWLEQGKVIGNVTLQPADHSGMRWRISNVAVAPEHRGRGIARKLMLAALHEIAERGAVWSVLQVRADNPYARRLYAGLGFTEVCADGVWRLAALPSQPQRADKDVSLERLRASAWRPVYELAKSAQSPLQAWAHEVTSSEHRADAFTELGEKLGRLTGLWRADRWGVWEDGRLMGIVETRAAVAGTVTLRFVVRPEARGALEEALVAQGLYDLSLSGLGPVTVEHSADHEEGVAALEAAGFRPQRILVTMRRRVAPADRET